MLDESSFDQGSFSSQSWLFGLAEAARRVIVRLASPIRTVVNLTTRLWN